MGHTTAIIEAEARRTPAKIRILFEVDSSTSKNTIVAMRKNVRTAMTIDTLSSVDMMPKND